MQYSPRKCRPTRSRERKDSYVKKNTERSFIVYMRTLQIACGKEAVYNPRKTHHNTQVTDKCTICGSHRHPPGERCSATGVICHNCQIKFKTQCRSTKTKYSMAGISFDQLSVDDAFLGAVNTSRKLENDCHNQSWSLSQEEVIAISEDIYKVAPGFEYFMATP